MPADVALGATPQDRLIAFASSDANLFVVADAAKSIAANGSVLHRTLATHVKASSGLVARRHVVRSVGSLEPCVDSSVDSTVSARANIAETRFPIASAEAVTRKLLSIRHTNRPARPAVQGMPAACKLSNELNRNRHKPGRLPQTARCNKTTFERQRGDPPAPIRVRFSSDNTN